VFSSPRANARPAGDRSAKTIVCGSFGLNQPEDPFCAGSPGGDMTSVGFVSVCGDLTI
jgi:hypothetical protein